MKRLPLNRRRWMLLAVGISALLLCVLFLGPRESVSPPVMVSVQQSNGPVGMFSGINGAFVILPDGSLWRWGQPGGFKTRTAVPERVGTNSDWVKAVAANNHSVGLRRNGTLWEWGWRPGGTGNAPPPPDAQSVSPDADWADVSVGDVHAAALKRDGTLWAWGDGRGTPLGDGLFTATNDPIRIGTNSDWAAVQCGGSFTLGVRSNGTLWFWGGWNWYTGTPPAKVFVPTQLCSETNWTGFAGIGIARNAAGECWQIMPGAPNAQAAVRSMAILIASNAQPRDVAFAFLKNYERRADGTLWKRSRPTWLGTPPSSYRTSGTSANQKTPRPLLRFQITNTNAPSTPSAGK